MVYANENSKYGFIYIWYDCKHKMYYIGCHWGTENDGYICSSNWMKRAYAKRPEDFRRRILERVTDRRDLLEREQYWLNFIQEDEAGTKYYNLNTKSYDHWGRDEETRALVLEKLSQAAAGKKKNFTPEEAAERGKKISEAKQRKKEERLSETGIAYTEAQLAHYKELKGKVQPQTQTDEANRKRSESMKIAHKEGRAFSTKGMTFEWSDERRENHRKSQKDAHKHQKMYSKHYSEANKRAWAEGKYSNRKSNNMKEFIWVTLSDGSHTRIHKEAFDPNVHTRGRGKLPSKEKAIDLM